MAAGTNQLTIKAVKNLTSDILTIYIGEMSLERNNSSKIYYIDYIIHIMIIKLSDNINNYNCKREYLL